MISLPAQVIIGIILLTAFIIPQQMSELRSFNVDDAEVATFDDHSGNGHGARRGLQAQEERRVGAVPPLRRQSPNAPPISLSSPSCAVIYTGDTSLEAIDHFVSEFFHNSHGKQVMSVVAIGMERPSSALKNYLRANSNGQRVTYLQVSAMVPRGGFWCPQGCRVGLSPHCPSMLPRQWPLTRAAPPPPFPTHRALFCVTWT